MESISCLILLALLLSGIAYADDDQCIVHEEKGNFAYKREDDTLFFTHIPKAGGRVVSYWLLKSYGISYTFPHSRPAKPFERHSKYYNVNVKRNDVAFSHHRPELGEKYLKQNGVKGNIATITFLRPVAEHRMSMLKKYVSKSLKAVLKKNGINIKRNDDLKFKQWLFLDGENVHWKKQTYARPQLGRQPIGYKTVRLDGARSYQLKWVARGRKNTNPERECSGNSQNQVQQCNDDRLLEQGKQAILKDYAFFGLLHRYQESMCMLHFHTRVPWPAEATSACSKNLREPCLKNTTCEPEYVCWASTADRNVHGYQDRDYVETMDLIEMVEQPEIKFLSWAEDIFELRYQNIKQELLCQLEHGTFVPQKEDWFGDGCFGISKSEFTRNIYKGIANLKPDIFDSAVSSLPSVILTCLLISLLV